MRRFGWLNAGMGNENVSVSGPQSQPSLAEIEFFRIDYVGIALHWHIQQSCF